MFIEVSGNDIDFTLDTLNEQIGKIQSKVGFHSGIYEKQKAELDECVSLINKKRGSALSTIRKQKSSLNQEQANSSELAKQINETNENIKYLRKSLPSKINDENKNIYDRMMGRIRTYETLLSNLNAKYYESIRREKALSSHINQLQSFIDEMNRGLDEAKKGQTNLKNGYETFFAAAGSCVCRLTSLAGSVQKMGDALEAYNRDRLLNYCSDFSKPRLRPLSFCEKSIQGFVPFASTTQKQSPPERNRSNISPKLIYVSPDKYDVVGIYNNVSEFKDDISRVESGMIIRIKRYFSEYLPFFANLNDVIDYLNKNGFDSRRISTGGFYSDVMNNTYHKKR